MADEISSKLGRLLIVGGGRMGQAICAGLLGIDGIEASQIVVANPGQKKRKHIEKVYGVETVCDALEALPADTVILAIKPAIVAEVAESLAHADTSFRLVISIAAGIATSQLAALFKDRTQIVRVMPNIALVVGQGMSGVSGAASTSAENTELVCKLFSHMGHAVIVDEDKQDAICAISGSGPAYFEFFCETIARAGVDIGLEYGIARELAVQTMYGTATLIDATDQDLPSAIDAVCSPGGTTLAALDAMRAAGAGQALVDGVKAACSRSKELGGNA